MKKVIVVLLLILLTGCANRDLTKVYNNMETGKDGINGYSIDLRIYGTVGKTKYNEIVRISNYMDEDFEVKIIDTNVTSPTEINEESVYVIDGKVYELKDDKYTETSRKQYTNPLIYIEGLKKVNKTYEKKDETLGNNTYELYNVRVSKSYIEDLLKEINIDLKVDDDVTADVYVTEDNQLYRIIYYINDLTVNVNYFGLDSAREIVLPE